NHREGASGSSRRRRGLQWRRPAPSHHGNSPPMSTHGNEPAYGQRRPPQHVPPRTAPRAARGPAASPRAARRMARGLSFTLVLLGLLLGGGLAALGHAWGWAVGALLGLPGLAGFVVVQ